MGTKRIADECPLEGAQCIALAGAQCIALAGSEHVPFHAGAQRVAFAGAECFSQLVTVSKPHSALSTFASGALPAASAELSALSSLSATSRHVKPHNYKSHNCSPYHRCAINRSHCLPDNSEPHSTLSTFASGAASAELSELSWGCRKA